MQQTAGVLTILQDQHQGTTMHPKVNVTKQVEAMINNSIEITSPITEVVTITTDLIIILPETMAGIITRIEIIQGSVQKNGNSPRV